jgi:amino acid transporter
MRQTDHAQVVGNQSAVFEGPVTAIAVKEKGLKRNAISFLSNIVIGLASAAPGYSLASALGTIAGIAAFGTPAIMLTAFIPMLCIATAYFQLNHADPDCGTTFSWATRAMGPHAGWISGWAIIVTNIIVMPSLAVIAGQYSFQLFGSAQPSTFQVTLLGVAWIIFMTAICYIGIELSARTQRLLLAAELTILVIFAVVALAKVYSGHALAGAMPITLSWFNPFAVGNASTFTQALLVAVFIYWGWDSAVSINEETESPGTAPGHAAVVSTVLLVAIYVLVAVAAVAFAGPDLLSKNSADIFAPIGKSVLGPGLDKLLILAVLTSASASTQTTILPAARTALSMANAGAIPKRFGEIHPHYLSPGFATLVMGAVSIVWYVGLTIFSKNVLDDSILALGLGISFYYAVTGFACVIFYRRELSTSIRRFLFVGLLPALGGLSMLTLFVKSCFELKSAGSTAIIGIGAPLVIGAGALLVGAVMMMCAQRVMPEFFRRKLEVAAAMPIVTSRAVHLDP